MTQRPPGGRPRRIRRNGSKHVSLSLAAYERLAAAARERNTTMTAIIEMACSPVRLYELELELALRGGGAENSPPRAGGDAVEGVGGHGADGGPS